MCLSTLVSTVVIVLFFRTYLLQLLLWLVRFSPNKPAVVLTVVSTISTRVVTKVKPINDSIFLNHFFGLDFSRLAWSLEIQFTFP